MKKHSAQCSHLWIRNEETRQYVFDNIGNMVIKRTNQSGVIGMVMGNKAEEKELDTLKKRSSKHQENLLPNDIKLSTVPCLIDGKLQPRHVDLRPYALCGPNGNKDRTRRIDKSSAERRLLVVNSSQGAAAKTWVVDLKRREAVSF